MLTPSAGSNVSLLKTFLTFLLLTGLSSHVLQILNSPRFIPALNVAGFRPIWVGSCNLGTAPRLCLHPRKLLLLSYGMAWMWAIEYTPVPWKMLTLGWCGLSHIHWFLPYKLLLYLNTKHQLHLKFSERSLLPFPFSARNQKMKGNILPCLKISF